MPLKALNIFIISIFQRSYFTVKMALPNLDLSEDFIADTPPQDQRSQWRTANSGAENVKVT